MKRTKAKQGGTYVKTNDAAALLVGLSVRRFQELKDGLDFPKRTAAGWRKSDLLRWAAKRPGRLSGLGKEGAAIQADIFNTRAQILEIQEAIVAGRMIAETDFRQLLLGFAGRLRFHVQNAFEHYALAIRDAAALADAKEAYHDFCVQAQSALAGGES